MMKFLPLCLLTLLIAGCVNTPEIAVSDPIYAKPKTTLEQKAQLLRGAIDQWCVDDEGLLLWRCYPELDLLTGSRFHDWEANPGELESVFQYKLRPLTDPGRQISYNMADMPAWQGQYLSGLAFEWAVTGISTEAKIIAALNALENSYKATGVPGVMVRAWIKHDSDERLPWMKTRERANAPGESEDQGWWMKGENGFWYRHQTAGGHHQGVWTAFCILGALQRDGKINLSPEGLAAAQRVIAPLYARIVANDGNITNADGSVTGFGNMRVYGVNMQFALWHLTRTTAAALFDVPGAQAEYEDLVGSYSSVIKASYGALVPILKRLPVHRRLKANDLHWQHHAWLGLIVAHGADSDENMRTIRRGFETLYQIHDPFNIHNWTVQKAGRPGFIDQPMAATAREAFEWYPLNKFVFTGQHRTDTDKWQPYQNRKINTAYAKGKAYQKATVGEHTGATRSGTYQCGFDYIMIYYAARYFNVLPKSIIEP